MNMSRVFRYYPDISGAYVGFTLLGVIQTECGYCLGIYQTSYCNLHAFVRIHGCGVMLSQQGASVDSVHYVAPLVWNALHVSTCVHAFIELGPY